MALTDDIQSAVTSVVHYMKLYKVLYIKAIHFGETLQSCDNSCEQFVKKHNITFEYTRVNNSSNYKNKNGKLVVC